MKKNLITFDFVRMMLPPTKPLAPDPIDAAILQRRLEEARWRQYDFPAYRRFVSRREQRTIPVAELTTEQLPALLRRQAQ